MAKKFLNEITLQIITDNHSINSMTDKELFKLINSGQEVKILSAKSVMKDDSGKIYIKNGRIFDS